MISLYPDEDSVRRALARGLRANGVDVITALEAGKLRAGDEDQLRFATSHGRAIYTTNLGHYHDLHNKWLSAGLHHAGIIVLPNQLTPVGAQIRALAKLANAFTPETMRDQFESLSKWL